MNFWWKLALLIALVAAVLGGTGKYAYDKGWIAGDKHARGELMPRIVSLEEEKIAAERQATAAREEGRAKADRLASELQVATGQVATLRRSLDDEIRSRTSAVRRAVDAATVRLLNQLTPIRGPVGPDGKTGAAPAGTDEAGRLASFESHTAGRPDEDDGSGASEQAVALALNERGELYLRCRARLTALVAWARDVSQ